MCRATDGVTIFFLKQVTTFLVIDDRPLKSDDLFSAIVTTPTLSAFKRRLSSILRKFSRQKINFIRV